MKRTRCAFAVGFLHFSLLYSTSLRSKWRNPTGPSFPSVFWVRWAFAHAADTAWAEAHFISVPLAQTGSRVLNVLDVSRSERHSPISTTFKVDRLRIPPRFIRIREGADPQSHVHPLVALCIATVNEAPPGFQGLAGRIQPVFLRDRRRRGLDGVAGKGFMGDAGVGPVRANQDQARDQESAEGRGRSLLIAGFVDRCSPTVSVLPAHRAVVPCLSSCRHGTTDVKR